MRNTLFTSEQPKRYNLCSCQKVCYTIHFPLDNIFIRFGYKLFRQIVGVSMETNCPPLVVDLFLFCYERDFILSLWSADVCLWYFMIILTYFLHGITLPQALETLAVPYKKYKNTVFILIEVNG